MAGPFFWNHVVGFAPVAVLFHTHFDGSRLMVVAAPHSGLVEHVRTPSMTKANVESRPCMWSEPNSIKKLNNNGMRGTTTSASTSFRLVGSTISASTWPVSSPGRHWDWSRGSCQRDGQLIKTPGAMEKFWDEFEKLTSVVIHVWWSFSRVYESYLYI